MVYDTYYALRSETDDVLKYFQSQPLTSKVLEILQNTASLRTVKILKIKKLD